MRYKHLTRVLALNLHPRRFGYVVVEGPDKLLDWGVRSHRQKSNSADVLIRRRLRPLLALWRPSLLVICGARQVPLRGNLFRKSLLTRIATEAKRHRVPVRILIKNPGEGPGKRLTKYENARRVAEQFPVLTHKLPPKRKPWESEDYRMSMFAAATLAMAQLNITIPSTPAILGSLAPPFSWNSAPPRAR